MNRKEAVKEFIDSLEDYSEFDKIILQTQKEIKFKNDSSNLKIIGIKGELRDYQKEGVAFLMASNGRALLADQPGLGKTLQTLTFVAHNKVQKTLVVCPASVKGVWENEVTKWTKLKSYVVTSKTKLTIDVISENDIIIINYDILLKFINFLTTVRFDCLVVDECQLIKSTSAKRSKCVKLIGKNIPSIILLSGTPMLNRPVELFNTLNLIDPKEWDNYYKFTRRYCNGHQGRWGYDASGSSNIDELREKIKKYFLRRTKDVVLKELPPKTFIDIPIDLEKEVRIKYDYAEESFIEYLRDIKKKNNKEIDRSMSSEMLVKLNELRQLTSDGKIKIAKEIIENIIDGGEKIVVFSVYNNPLLELKEYFGNKSVILTGKSSEKEKNDAINNFQNKDECVIFLGGLKSAGVGITLTASPNVLLIDYSYIPADMEQGIDRIHRHGQKADHATIYQLVANKTIDQKIQKILAEKKKIIDKLIDGKEFEDTKNTSVVNDLLKEFK